jgi:hypothetical protein
MTMLPLIMMSVRRMAGNNYAVCSKCAYNASAPDCFGTYDPATGVYWAKNAKCKEIILGSACALFGFNTAGCHYAQMKVMVDGEMEPTLYHMSCLVEIVDRW